MKCHRCDEPLTIEESAVYAGDDDYCWYGEILCGWCAAEDAADNARNAERRHGHD